MQEVVFFIVRTQLIEALQESLRLRIGKWKDYRLQIAN